jgi:trehalose synthase
MSVGCPIVTTATTAMPEFIVSGNNGYITNDPLEMRERLEELIKNPELGRKIGEAGRQTVIEKFGQERFLYEWDQILRKVADCPPGKL